MFIYNEDTNTVIPTSEANPMAITEVTTALLMSAPFFAMLLFSSCRIVFREDIPTLATDGNDIFINLAYFESLTLGERIFAIAHEVAHCMLSHMVRSLILKDLGFNGLPFHPTVYNVACDLVINPMLIAAKIGTFKKSWLLDSKYTAESVADDVYEDLIKRFPPPPPSPATKGDHSEGGNLDKETTPGASSGQDTNPDMPYKDGTLDQHIPATAKKNEFEWKQAVEAAASAAKAQGKMPGVLQRWVDEIVEPQIPWKEKLQIAISSNTTTDARSWKKYSRRRMVSQRIYLPGRVGHGADCVVVGFDTSGSVGQDEATAFLGEMSGILAEVNPKELWALAVDARVHTATLLDDVEGLNDFKNNKLRGGGGTDMTKIFDWIKDNDKEPQCCVILTDGYTPFGEQQAYPVIWVCSSLRVSPYGETIFIKV